MALIKSEGGEKDRKFYNQRPLLFPPDPANINGGKNEERKEQRPQGKENPGESRPDEDAEGDQHDFEETRLPPFQRERFE